MKLTEKQACELWGDLCAPAGEYCVKPTVLGVVAQSHGLEMRVDEMSMGSREKIAEWLRSFADAIDFQEATKL